MEERRLYTIALGCQMSVADSSELAEPFLKRGFKPARSEEEADAIVVSTCTVRDHAEHRALSLIGRLKEWKDRRAGRLLVVAGCAAQRLEESLARRFPHVDLVLGAKSIGDSPALLDGLLGSRYDAAQEDGAAFQDSFRLLAAKNPQAPGFVTVMRGCNYSCSYCIVPAVRGRELYRDPREILGEIERKVRLGVREITLLGQTVNSYRSGETDFGGLLRAAGAVEGVERLRFMSPHPHYFGEAMVDAMAETPAVCESVHLPLQSGCDRILKLMRRNYTRGLYRERVELLRRRIPDLELTTDIIVGFPSETEGEFTETLDFLKAVKPVGAYCFKFSPRPQTAAAELPGSLPEDVKAERLSRLNAVVDELSREAMSRWVGRTVPVLADEPAFGRTRQGLKVRLDRPVRPGETVPARLAAVTGMALAGEVAL